MPLLVVIQHSASLLSYRPQAQRGARSTGCDALRTSLQRMVRRITLELVVALIWFPCRLFGRLGPCHSSPSVPGTAGRCDRPRPARTPSHRAVPCAHQLGENGVGVDWEGPRLRDTGKGDVGRHRTPVARRVDDGEDLVACGERTQCRKRHADAGQCARDEQRLAFGFFDGLDPRRVVPGVDLAVARDVNRVRIVLVDFGNERAVRAVRHRSGGEGGELYEAGDLRERGNVRAQNGLLDVSDELE